LGARTILRENHAGSARRPGAAIAWRLAASLVVVSLWGCNSLLGIDAVDETGSAGGAGSGEAGKTGDAGRPGSGGGGGSGGGPSGPSGSGGQAPVAPCQTGEVPGEGVFVDARDGDDDNDGSAAQPFRTLTQAANQAVARELGRVFLAPGLYQEALVLRSASDEEPGTVSAPEGTALSFDGGWKLDGARWQRDCAPDARDKTVLASNTTTGVSIRGPFGAIEFRNLSIATATDAPAAAEGQPGASCYGVNASGAGLRLRLENVVVDACPGAEGAAGLPGAAGDGAIGCDGSASCADGKSGAEATATGLPAEAGTFDQDGYVATVGAVGPLGSNGANGVAGPGTPGFVQCHDDCGNPCESLFDLVRPHGTCGCGGKSGGGGLGGPGGGASVALFVRGPNASVDLSFATLRARAGGDGAPGGEGGEGAEGAVGKPFGGDPSCCPTLCQFSGGTCTFLQPSCTVLPAQPAGGVGGKGGKGGKGGGGSGGPSFSLVRVGQVTVTRDASALLFGEPGAGADGAPSGEAGDERQITLP
jgi:hypothetical protein